MSYLEQYGQSYEDWIKEKAKRILYVLLQFLNKEIPIDINYLLIVLYYKRLEKASFLSYRAYEKNESFRLLDKKPSPFMKHFINFLLEKLTEDNYLKKVEWYEYRDKENKLVLLSSPTNDPNLTLVDYGERFYAKSLPSFDYLVNLIAWHDPQILESLAYQEAEKELNY
jgi:hypothetical protein